MACREDKYLLFVPQLVNESQKKFKALIHQDGITNAIENYVKYATKRYQKCLFMKINIYRLMLLRSNLQNNLLLGM